MPEHSPTLPAGPDYPQEDLQRPAETHTRGQRSPKGRHAAGSDGPSRDATADIEERTKRGSRPDPDGRDPTDAPPS